MSLEKCIPVVSLAQLVRVPGCGPGGRGFDSHSSPQDMRLSIQPLFYTMICGSSYRCSFLEECRERHIIAVIPVNIKIVILMSILLDLRNRFHVLELCRREYSGRDILPVLLRVSANNAVCL
jgi:hypothetical protein